MLRLTFKIKKDVTKDELLAEVCNKNKINIKDIEDWHIIKKSIDARNKADVHYVYILDFKLKNELKYSKTKNVQIINETTSQNAFKIEHKALSKRPVIIGAGPAGLFAAITFVENGLFPIIVEQGKSVDERQKDINSFIKTGILNTNSNIQFGEGGAGTFSDGKLTTGINSAYCKTVLETAFWHMVELSYLILNLLILKKLIIKFLKFIFKMFLILLKKYHKLKLIQLFLPLVIVAEILFINFMKMEYILNLKTFLLVLE